MLDLNPHEVSQVRLIETSTQAKDRKHIEARGEIVYSWSPKDAEELEEQLDHLAQMIATEEDNRVLGGRKGQLELQFHDVADQVRLAKMKHNYILTRARVGDDFHPWTTQDNRVFRIECVRPLPADFELSPWGRKDRERRRAEAIRIFGQAELETREWMSALKNRGYDCRRPHPNAQEFLVRAYLGEHSKYGMVVAPSANGLWEVSAKDAQNKRETGLRARCLRDGHVRALTNVVAEIMN
ncbi:hypothetical protein [Salipiger sp. PrR003]|uniref:hypothetical protein n=1 Tax=Salipiger sp. PrR003 TaxID=2706776 RepID=UPI0013DCF099|nr:hypothetical protein [Salipiger sp. PrR003]NDV52953.1 hypothetical protein [Salipiger sp. PrR003]